MKKYINWKLLEVRSQKIKSSSKKQYKAWGKNITKQFSI